MMFLMQIDRSTQPISHLLRLIRYVHPVLSYSHICTLFYQVGTKTSFERMERAMGDAFT